MPGGGAVTKLAGKFVKPAPLPERVPERVTPLAPLVTTVAGSCAKGYVPLT